MAGTANTWFFWQDWQGDVELKLCSPGAQATWMRLLCIAGVAEDNGRCTVAGRPITVAEFKAISGFTVPDDDVRGWFAEIVRNRVCDVDADQAMVSRRLRRNSASGASRQHGGAGPAVDPANSPAQQVAAGKRRAELSTRDSSGKFQPVQREVQRAGPAPVQPSQAHSHNHSQAQAAAGAGAVPLADQRDVDTIGDILQIWTGDRRRDGWLDQLHRLNREGLDTHLHIIPAIQKKRDQGTVPGDLQSLRYFRSLAYEQKGATAAQASQAAPPTEAIDWPPLLERWVQTGHWEASKHGPRPDHPGCRAPADQLTVTLQFWNAHGAHPRKQFCLEQMAFVPWGEATKPDNTWEQLH